MNGVWGSYENTGSCVCNSVNDTTGLQTQERQCDDPAPQHGGNNCVGNSTRQVQCNCTVESKS